MLDSPASPDAVLAAIAADVRDWREPRVPDDVRGLGLLRLDASVSGRSFRVACLCDRRTPVRPVLRGTVESRPDGASRVVARVQMQRSSPVLLVVFALTGAGLLLGGSPTGLAPLGLAGSIFLQERYASRAVAEDHPFGRYLAERLKAAIAAAEGGGDAAVGAARP